MELFKEQSDLGIMPITVNFSSGFGAGIGNISMDDIMSDYKTKLFVYHDLSNIILISLYILVFLTAAISNTLVILVVYRYHHLRSVTNYFLVNLSVADLLVTLVCMPMAVGTSILKAWLYGEFMCKFTAYLQGVAVSASVFSILAMSIDRYLAIRHPMILRQVFNKRVARTAIGIIWVVAAIIFFPMLVVRRLEGVMFTATDDNIFFCVEHWPQTWDKRLYGASLFVVVYAVPGLLVLVAYTSTGFKLCAPTVFKDGGDMVLDRDSKLLQGRRRVARTLLILAIVFACCWLPYNIVMLVLDSKLLTIKTLKTVETLMDSLPFTLLLGHANSALNPVLYCFFSRNFRQCVLNMLRRKRGRTTSIKPKSYQRCRSPVARWSFRRPRQQPDPVTCSRSSPGTVAGVSDSSDHPSTGSTCTTNTNSCRCQGLKSQTFDGLEIYSSCKYS